MGFRNSGKRRWHEPRNQKKKKGNNQPKGPWYADRVPMSNEELEKQIKIARELMLKGGENLIKLREMAEDKSVYKPLRDAISKLLNHGPDSPQTPGSMKPQTSRDDRIPGSR